MEDAATEITSREELEDAIMQLQEILFGVLDYAESTEPLQAKQELEKADSIYKGIQNYVNGL